MTGADPDRGLSLGTGAAIAVAGVILVVAGVFLGAAALGGGGPSDAGNETTPTATTTSSPTPGDGGTSTTTTQKPGTMTTTTTPKPSSNLTKQFEQTFKERLEARHDKVQVIDIETRGNTVYVTAHGPDVGGPAMATVDDLAEAFTDAMKTDWANESRDWGVDHAVISLHSPDNHHWFNVRIEESWAYRYYTGDIDLDKITSMVYRTDHQDQTKKWLESNAFVNNISSIEGVEVRSLEQYAGTYFLAFESDTFSGDEFNRTLFRISEALNHHRTDKDVPVFLNYVVYAENGTAMKTNRWSSALSSGWHEGAITRNEYRLGLVDDEFDATQIPDDIGSMTTRIEPFPADGPDE